MSYCTVYRKSRFLSVFALVHQNFGDLFQTRIICKWNSTKVQISYIFYIFFVPLCIKFHSKNVTKLRQVIFCLTGTRKLCPAIMIELISVVISRLDNSSARLCLFFPSRTESAIATVSFGDASFLRAFTPRSLEISFFLSFPLLNPTRYLGNFSFQ